LRELPFWIVENLAQPLPVEVLAQRVSMSPRNFSRRFRLEFGLTPARFVAQLRAQSARQLLAEADRGRAAVAAACGFGSVDSMDRALAQSGGPMPAGA
jgi:transcriptional regulator GlxA family with amidase domain